MSGLLGESISRAGFWRAEVNLMLVPRRTLREGTVRSED